MSDQLPAGTDLDRAVAEALGWKPGGQNDWTSPLHREGYDDWEAKGTHDYIDSPDGRHRVYFCRCNLSRGSEFPAVSTDWSAFGWLLDEMKQLGYSWEFVHEFSEKYPGWTDRATFWSHPVMFIPPGQGYSAWGVSILEAGARAALAALRKEQGE